MKKNLNYFFLIFLIFSNCLILKNQNNFLENFNIININLLNGLVNIHPNFLIFFYSFILFIFLFSKKNFKKIILTRFFEKSNLIFIIFYKLLITGLILGAWWASQELNWGGWWNWDPVEFVGFLFIILFLSIRHFLINKLNINKLNKYFFKLVITTIIITRLDILNSIHNFVVNDLTNNNSLIIIILISYILITFLLKLQLLKLNLNNIYFKLIIILSLILILYLLYTNIFFSLNIDNYMFFFKKLLLIWSLIFFTSIFKINFNLLLLIIFFLGFYIIYIVIQFFKISKRFEILHISLFVSLIYIYLYDNYSFFLFLNNIRLNFNFYYTLNMVQDLYYIKSEQLIDDLILNSHSTNLKKVFNKDLSIISNLLNYDMINFKMNITSYKENISKNNFFLYVYNNLSIFFVIYIINIFKKNINLKFF